MVFISLVVTLEHVSDASRVSWSSIMTCKKCIFFVSVSSVTCQVSHGAKHSPPVSDRGPICQKGSPPEWFPETPLTKVFAWQIFTKSIIGNTD